jgi:hypothetical protein
VKVIANRYSDYYGLFLLNFAEVTYFGNTKIIPSVKFIK